MNILDRTPALTHPKAIQWEKRLVAKIKRTVRKERAFGMTIGECMRYAAHRREADAVAVLAELAGVDWLYNPNTGEVRFFEFN